MPRWFSGDPKGSVGELRNVDFGLRNEERLDPESRPPTHESRTTDHAKAQWPSKAISSQGVGEQDVNVLIASEGARVRRHDAARFEVKARSIRAGRGSA